MSPAALRNPRTRHGIVLGLALLMLNSRRVVTPGVTVAAVAPGRTNQVPFIHQPLVPQRAVPGGARFELTVNGAGFSAGATVEWNGSVRKTTFVSPSQLIAAIPDQDLAKAGTVSVTVVEADGPASNAAYFQVANPAPTVSFKSAIYPGRPAGSEPYGLTTGDFNGDGIPDLASTDIQGHQVLIQLGGPDGAFGDGVFYQTGLFPAAVLTGDFNADGKLDLAVADSGNPSNGAPGRVSILLGKGDGTFQAAASYATAEGPTAIVAGDFNGDGKLDIATADYDIALGNQVSVLLGNGDGTFQRHCEYTAGFAPHALVEGDFNGDGTLDLATANEISGTVSILLGNGDGTFQPHVDYAAGARPIALSAADFNGDGKLDLAVADLAGNSIGILLGNGDGTFGPVKAWPTGNRSAPVAVAAGDFNADGRLDLVVVSQGHNAVAILLGNGDGTFRAPVDTATALSPQDIAIADFNADGRLDIAVVDVFARATEVLLQNQPRQFPAKAQHSTPLLR